MPIELNCACGRRLRVADEHAGEQGRCPACGGLLRIPERDASPTSSPRSTAEGGELVELFGPDLVESHVTPSDRSATEKEAGPGGDERLTAAGCVLALLSVAVVFAVAIPIVRWRDPASGQPLPRAVAILSPVLIGAAVNGVGMLLLRLVGVRVWVKKVKDADE